jgi:hypothetical protein
MGELAVVLIVVAAATEADLLPDRLHPALDRAASAKRK